MSNIKGPSDYRKRLRQRLFDRQEGACAICGAKIMMPPDQRHAKGDKLWGPSFDHVIPVRDGGKSGTYNLQLTHRMCNSVRDQWPLEKILARVSESLLAS